MHLIAHSSYFRTQRRQTVGDARRHHSCRGRLSAAQAASDETDTLAAYAAERGDDSWIFACGRRTVGELHLRRSAVLMAAFRRLRERWRVRRERIRRLDAARYLPDADSTGYGDPRRP